MGHSHSHGPQETWLTVACAVSLTVGAVAQYTALLPAQVAILFYLISYGTGGYHGFIETLYHLRNLEFNIDFLMISAAIGAAILGQWVEGAILLFLFSLSGSLESYALGKSRTAIHSLLKLRPSKGLLKHPDGREEFVPIEQLEVGQVVIVKPGEHIPIDGKVISGQTTVDQATITGESVPVSKEPGDSVFAATLNENGAIEIEVTKPAKDTTVAKIIELVESAQKNKAKTQRFLDTFEPRYAITVVVSVILLILIPWLLLGHDFDSTFYRAMTVLVVASPCALIISTPASIISAIANGAKNGILFKGGAHVEQTVGIDTIAFDKTGTLTPGTPKVTDIFSLDKTNGQPDSDPDTQNYVMRIAAGCEIYSEHHLAEAILEKAGEMKIDPFKMNDMQASPGKGVVADWNGKMVAVGNQKMFEDSLKGWNSGVLKQAEALRKEGKTVVFVVEENRPVGLIALADEVRPRAKQTISALRKMGIKKIVMLTGDNRGVADAIAAELGIDEVHADLLPEEKVKIVEKLKTKGTVAMVGDGVNDAPALAVSDLGIAMGAAGTDVALETADVVLMGDDLTKLPYLLWLSRKSRRVVWQNIIFSMGVIMMLLAGVFLIDLPLTAGVIGHEGSTLLVVLNGLRLLKRGEIPL
ncbi:MAG: heavy metal translocating P-type ATPase [Balneolaceae bacterium]|nr:heavy metal translocating P-type ATPase [Balneolaceae bacterium]